MVFLHEVSLHIGDCIPDLIVVLNVVGVENVHALCLFTERPRVERMGRLFPFVAKSTDKSAQPDKGVISEEFAECQHGEEKVKRR